MEIIFSALLGLLAGAGVNYAADALIAARGLPKTQMHGRALFICALTACLFALLAARFGATLRFALTAIYTIVLLIVLVTDWEHRLIFDVVILPATLFAALASPLAPMGWKLALLGGAVAFVLVLGIYLCAGLFARARRLKIAGGAFGQGDVKLATFIGIVVGFPNALPMILFTVLLGGIGACVFLAYQFIAHRRVALTAAIPYGPFFCVAGWWWMIQL